jgi:Holliday junction resolvase-like predicted endonuclease
LAKELASESSADGADPASRSSQGGSEEKVLEINLKGGVGKSTVLARAYLVESLVFQALQAELGGSVRRDVVVRGVHIDGLVYSPDGTITIVEVKMFSSSSSEVVRRIREARARLLEIRAAFYAEAQHSIKLLLALVVEGDPGHISEFRDRWSRSEDIAVRVYGFLELIERYGLANQGPQATS